MYVYVLCIVYAYVNECVYVHVYVCVLWTQILHVLCSVEGSKDQVFTVKNISGKILDPEEFQHASLGHPLTGSLSTTIAVEGLTTVRATSFPTGYVAGLLSLVTGALQPPPSAPAFSEENQNYDDAHLLAVSNSQKFAPESGLVHAAAGSVDIDGKSGSGSGTFDTPLSLNMSTKTSEINDMTQNVILDTTHGKMVGAIEEAGSLKFHATRRLASVEPGPATVQNALASASAGSTLLLMAGDYHLSSSISVSKDITIRAASPGQARLYGNGHRVILISSGTVVLENLHIAEGPPSCSEV